MLLLAAVTISVAMNGGLFQQANNAAILTDVANTRELVQADIMEKQIVNQNGKVKYDKSNENNELMNILKAHSKSGTTPQVSENGNGTVTATITNGKGHTVTIENIPVEKIISPADIHVGDYVKYVAKGSDYTAYAAKTGSSSDKYNTAPVRTDVNWQVLYKDEEKN
jgi:hypothetical protein